MGQALMGGPPPASPSWALRYMDEIAIPTAEEAVETAERLALSTGGSGARARAESLAARLVGLKLRRSMIAREANARSS